MSHFEIIFTYSFYWHVCLWLRECCATSLIEKHFRDVADVEGFTDEVTNSTSEQLEALDSVFSKAAEFDTPAEVMLFYFGGFYY